MGEVWGENEAEWIWKQKLGNLGGWKSWQQAKHAKLYSNPLHAQNEGTVDCPGLLPRGGGGGGGFLCPRYPTAGKERKKEGKERNEERKVNKAKRQKEQKQKKREEKVRQKERKKQTRTLKKTPFTVLLICWNKAKKATSVSVEFGNPWRTLDVLGSISQCCSARDQCPLVWPKFR